MQPLTWMVLGLAAPLLLLSALRTDGNETDAEAPTVPQIMSLFPRECARGLWPWARWLSITSHAR
jgi:hypothetical protein